MSDKRLERMHIALMQELLPIGVAIVDRANEGGIKSLKEIFSSSDEPFAELRSEGEVRAHSLRDKLDKVFPGLGNPATSIDVVEVQDEMDNVEIKNLRNEEGLIEVLNRIEERLLHLNKFFMHDSDLKEQSSKPNQTDERK